MTDHEFATTHWSVVAAAGRLSSPEARQALEQLCTTYWYPLYTYVRRRTANLQDAQDLTQAFFTELLEKNWVAMAHPVRGRFRAFLLTAMQRFIARDWQASQAVKRGGGRLHLSLDFATAEARWKIDPPGGTTPEQFYQQQWAIALLERIVGQLETEYYQAGKQQLFEELKPFLVGEHSETSYAAVADRLGISTAAARQAGTRIRRRYRNLLRQEIAQTVSRPEDVDDEIRALFGAWNR